MKQTDFALVLLDIQMPGMDGYETAAEIKKLERGKNLPIVMVTAIFREDPHILKGYAVGAIDYIAKPFNPQILKAKVGVYTNLYLKSRQSDYLQEAERLLHEEGNARTILETMPIGVIVVDRSGAVRQLNREARHIWGVGTLPPDECKDYFGNEYLRFRLNIGRPLDRDEWAIARATDKGESTLCDIIQVQSLDGSKKAVLTSAIPLRDSLGEISGALEIMQDITAQQQLTNAIA